MNPRPLPPLALTSCSHCSLSLLALTVRSHYSLSLLARTLAYHSLPLCPTPVTSGACGQSVTSSDWYHIPPQYWAAWPRAWAENYCIVRDPLERALSAFKQSTAHGVRDKRLVNNSRAASEWIVREALSKTAHFGCNFLPQADFVWDALGNRTCQHVLCYERLRTDFDPLVAQLGLSLPPLSSQERVVHHATSVLTVSSLSGAAHEAVQQRFAQDVCFLGYGPCATQELARARAALEEPVRCGHAELAMPSTPTAAVEGSSYTLQVE